VTEVCGEHVTNNADEECDDGDTISGNGCTEACVTKAGGDRVISNNGAEGYDNGNTVSGDGCTAGGTVKWERVFYDRCSAKTYTFASVEYISHVLHLTDCLPVCTAAQKGS
jgi:cysteine-rich repeat protein